MSDDKLVETLRKASMAVYLCTDAETAKQISITFIRAAERIAALECRMVGLPPVREPSEFVTDVDGYVYFWPDRSNGGHYAAHHLRRIATELDDRNKEWDEQIQNDPVLAPKAMKDE